MVVYDSQVKQQLEEYDISLKSYPISASRRKEKVRRLRQFLQSIGRNVLSYPICDSKKLGQAFNAVNKPIDASLRQTHYQDESGTQWRMSFFMVSKNVVKIYRLYQAQFVDESLKTRNINKFKIEYKDNTMKTNKRVIRLNESKLHNIVAESVKRVLREWEEEIVYDRKGNEIHNGSIVIWRDPETGHKSRYKVYEEPTEDMVKLWSKYGECEALPHECIVVG